jgi:hypothetical protein
MSAVEISQKTGIEQRRYTQLPLEDMALLAANTISIAADPAGMADAAEMLSGVDSSLVCNGLVIQTDFSLNGPRCFADSVARVGLCRVQMTD